MQVRKYAVKGLGDIGDAKSVDALVKLFKSIPPTIYTREERLLVEETRNLSELVVNALGQLKAKEATPTFVKVLKSGRYSPDIRAIMKSLGEIGDNRAISALVDMLNDRNYFLSTSSPDGRRYTLNYCDLALEALLKITNQSYSDYGMAEPGGIAGYGGMSEILFESDEARNEGISKFEEWWAENSDKFISDEAAQAFEEEVEAQEIAALSTMPSMRIAPITRPPVRKKAPDFSLQAIDGKTIKLSDFKGKVIILNFWAAWSPLCFKEIPIFEELYKEHKDKGLVVIGVSIDRSEDAVRAFAEKLKVSYPIVLSTEEMIESYGGAIGEPIKTIPTTIIINKAGFIFKKYVSAQSKEVFEKDILQLLR